MNGNIAQGSRQEECLLEESIHYLLTVQNCDPSQSSSVLLEIRGESPPPGYLLGSRIFLKSSFTISLVKEDAS